MLLAVGEYAEFCIKLGNYERAVELCSLVNDHFASWHETRNHAAMLLDVLQKQMPTGKYAKSRNRGCKLDLWTCVEDSTSELEAKTTPVHKKKKSQPVSK
jgi:hypothetical protein